MRTLHAALSQTCLGLQLLAMSSFLCIATVCLHAQSLRSGKYELTVRAAGEINSGVAINLLGRAAMRRAAVDREPAEILVKEQSTLQTYRGGYSIVQRQAHSLAATAEITTDHGSVFQVTDVYRAAGASGAFQLYRRVKVLKAQPPDQGFNSRFSLGFEQPRPMADLQFFSPAIWYKQNAYASPDAIGGNYHDKYFYYREMRTALPFISMRDPQSGITVALCHLDSNISSGADETSPKWLVDGSIQYASLGVGRLPDPRIGVIFPAIEGERNYVARAQHFVYRSHPVQPGFQQHYSLVIKADKYDSYRAMIAGDWRFFYKRSAPKAASVPLQTIYSAEIHLLGHYARVHNGVMGWPFVVDVTDGKIASDRNGKGLSISYQMGYVGQQLPDAYELIRFGLLHKDRVLLSKGMRIVNFWAQKSPLPSGLPQVWYNVDPPTFRNGSLIYMRQATDGMEGALAAALVMRHHGMPQADWERFCSRFGDWLVSHQNSDGSFYRAYHADSTVAQKSKLNTTDPIRFLVRLYAASGDRRYLQSALRAGEFSLINITQPSLYVGGTVDRPDPVQDKEAGVEAIRAFLSLYDATRQAKWLKAAVAAAEFTETWNLSWQYHIETDEPAFRRAGTRGQGFIKSGTSGVDIFLSFEACDYYRLFLYTSDSHFLDFAKVLLANTKLTTDWNGSLGYAYPGLVREASDLANIKTNPHIGWLPWLSDAELSSMTELDDIFGSKSIGEIEKLPLATRHRDNNKILGRPGEYGWISR